MMIELLKRNGQKTREEDTRLLKSEWCAKYRKKVFFCNINKRGKTMKIVNKSTETLIPYIRNSRTHSEEQVSQIMASIREFGFTNPLLIDEKDEIIAGHGRLLASQRLKLKEVPCIILSGLSDAQKRVYSIAR